MNKDVIKKAQVLLDRTLFNFSYYEKFRLQFGEGKKIEKLDTDEKVFLKKIIENNIFMTIINISVLYDKKDRKNGEEVLSFYQIAKDIGYTSFKKELNTTFKKQINKIGKIKEYRSKALAHVDYEYCINGFPKDFGFSYEDLSDLISIGYNIIEALTSHIDLPIQKINNKIQGHSMLGEDRIVEKVCNALI